MKDCDPSEVPQVKTRFFGTWCQEFYSIAFQYAVEQAKKAAESMFMVQEMQIGESSAQIDSVREQEKLKEELERAAAEEKAEAEATIARNEELKAMQIEKDKKAAEVRGGGCAGAAAFTLFAVAFAFASPPSPSPSLTIFP